MLKSHGRGREIKVHHLGWTLIRTRRHRVRRAGQKQKSSRRQQKMITTHKYLFDIRLFEAIAFLPVDGLEIEGDEEGCNAEACEHYQRPGVVV